MPYEYLRTRNTLGTVSFELRLNGRPSLILLHLGVAFLECVRVRTKYPDMSRLSYEYYSWYELIQASVLSACTLF